MTYYWFLVFILLFLCGVGTKSPSRNYILFIGVTLFFLFFALRVGFTPDYKNYEMSFSFLHNGKIDSRMKTEVGYQWLCQLLPSYRVMLIVQTLLFCICIYKAFKDYINPRYWMASFAILFFYEPFVLGNMAGLRSCFVTCLFFFALVAKIEYGKKGFIMAIALMGIALLFHRSSIALAPLILIPGKPFNKYINYLIYLMVIVGLYLGFRFANEINMYAFSIIQDEMELSGYQVYFENEVKSTFNFMMLIKYLLSLVLVYLTLKYSNEESDKMKSIFLKMATFLYIVMVLPFGQITGRYLYYFAFPCIIATPFAIQKAKSIEKPLYITSLVLIIIMELRFFYRGETLSYYMEYQNILFN